MPDGNLFAPLGRAVSQEVFEELLSGPAFRLERIVSTGQATPPGEWYDQPAAEWVVLLAGRARLRFEDGRQIEMTPGDHLHIPPHCRHRVEWTAPDRESIWLALYYRPDDTV